MPNISLVMPNISLVLPNISPVLPIIQLGIPIMQMELQIHITGLSDKSTYLRNTGIDCQYYYFKYRNPWIE